jgi:hypothetical protein
MKSDSSARIKNPWLTIARAAWLLIAPLNLILGIISLPTYYQKLSSLNVTAELPTGWTPPALQAALGQIGIPPSFLALWLILVSWIALLAYASIGFFIFWRKSDTWLGLFSSYVLVGLAGTFAGEDVAVIASISSPWYEIFHFATVWVWPALFIFLTIFPDGRFVPRWTRWTIPFWFLFITLGEVYLFATGEDLAFLFPVVFGLFGISVFSQVYRYRKVSGSIERQQTKWFLFVLAIWFPIAIFNNIYIFIFPALAQPSSTKLIIDLLMSSLVTLCGALVPISIGIALFRYHLWDIDIIIRRTLIYGGLTLTLALVYFGSVILLQSLVTAVGGQQTAVVTVISTLLIAALFTPLRKRIQRDIDRRFYRKKYDAEKIVAAFGASLREEVDLEGLQAQIVAVVEETLQPDMVSLWIRAGTDKKREVSQ